MDALSPPTEPVEVTIHDLARSYDALVATVQQLLYGDSRTDAHFLALPMEKGGSLYSLMNQRVNTGRLSPAQVVTVLSFVLRELDRHHAFLANLTSQRSRLVLRRSDVDLGELLNEVVELFEGPAVKKGIALRLNVQSKSVHERPFVYADKQQVYRLFMNVIDNAVKYSYSSTEQSFRHVDIICRRHTTEGHWLTTVESFGVGILPEEQGRVFEYGKRGELARDRDRHGSGIGLSEARRIASAHGGSLEIESRPAADSTEKEVAGRHEHPYVTIVKVVLPSR
jgi:signal transduction histidine kinase